VGTGLTGVRKAYQRQGIATYLKIKILKYFMDNHPDFEHIYTENAASNEAMLGINTSLGFKPTYDWQMYQGKLNEE
jgi:RimJ/RimL family protein N-acetyltransferase